MRSNLSAIALAALLAAAPVTAADGSGSGRISFFGTWQSSSPAAGESHDFSEVTTAIRFRSGAMETSGIEYAIDLRSSAYPSSEGRDPRTRIFDAWAGGRLYDGRLALRAGQMWLHELGALGSVAGATAEMTFRNAGPSKLRLGLFGGVEPERFDTGFVRDVKKGGAWIAVDAPRNRRHVLGYVLIRDAELTERSVVTTTTFLPLGRTFFLYQTAELDLTGPGGEGGGGLHYFFVNARYTPVPRFELMATGHRGRSIDTRRITEDILEGRPVDARALEGYLFESVGGRVTARLPRGVRLWAGYAQDRNNREDESSGRISAGAWLADVAGTGFDITLSDNRSSRPTGDHDAWYLSVGRGFGSRLYLSADYATSLSVIRVAGSGSTSIETRPRTKRYGMNGVWTPVRAVSFVFSAEQLRDATTTDDRGMLGLTYRF